MVNGRIGDPDNDDTFKVTAFNGQPLDPTEGGIATLTIAGNFYKFQLLENGDLFASGNFEYLPLREIIPPDLRNHGRSWRSFQSDDHDQR